MDIKRKAKEELETRVQNLENFIADNGLGSSYVARAKRVQRNVNLTIAVGSVITIAGITVWALNRSKED